MEDEKQGTWLRSRSTTHTLGGHEFDSKMVTKYPVSGVCNTYLLRLGRHNVSKADSEGMFQIIKDRYGNRLTPEELEEVKKGVERVVELGEELRAFKLGNGDQPYPSFEPYRGTEEE